MVDVSRDHAQNLVIKADDADLASCEPIITMLLTNSPLNQEDEGVATPARDESLPIPTLTIGQKGLGHCYFRASNQEVLFCPRRLIEHL